MIAGRWIANTLKKSAFLLGLLLSVLFCVTARADNDTMTGATVVDGTDIADNRETPLASLFTGTLNYRIPIDVPPGRNGMTPGIALTYSSNNGNGWVGVGWELEMGDIERSTKASVNNNGNNYVLRGPGGITELVNVSGNIYQAKIEGNFVKFVNQGSYWEATNKDGMRFRFGHDASTTLYNPDNTGYVFKWCLDRITDTNGNYITLSYAAYYTNKYSFNMHYDEIYLSRIDYTGNDAVSPALATTASVRFVLGSRNDAECQYAGYSPNLFRVCTGKRLNNIEVWAGSTLVRKYVLTYDAHSADGYSPLTERSMLGSITEYGSDGTTAKPAISFTYSNGYTVANGPASGSWSLSNIGLDPGVSFTLPIGMNCIPGRFGTYYDILCSTGPTGWDLKYLFHSLDKQGITLQWPNGPPPSLSMALGKQCVTGDFRGEGKNSLACYFSNNGDWTMVFPSGQNGEVWTTETWHNGPAPSLPLTNCFVGDFDGNGKSGIACYYAGNMHTALSNGSGWGSNLAQSLFGGNMPKKCLTGDFDGKGQTELACYGGVIYNYNDNGNGWSYRDAEPRVVTDFSLAGNFTGNSITQTTFFTESAPEFNWADYDASVLRGYWNWNVVRSGGDAPPPWNCVTGDFNGDGKTDIACYNGGSSGIWDMYMSTAITAIAGISVNKNYYHWDGGPVPATSFSQQCLTGDFYSQGKTSVACYISGNNWQVGTVNAPLTDLLTGIDNGLGSTVSITYTPAYWNNNNRVFRILVASPWVQQTAVLVDF